MNRDKTEYQCLYIEKFGIKASKSYLVLKQFTPMCSTKKDKKAKQNTPAAFATFAIIAFVRN